MSDTNASVTKTRAKETAIIDGKGVTAQEVAQIHEVKEIFNKLQKALKQISLYRHNTDRYGEYLADVYKRLADYLGRNNIMDLRVGPTNYRFRGVEVFQDESREGNLCYPFYQHGIRLLMFKDGLSAEELLKFILVIIDYNPKQRSQDDFVTLLWKAELQAIEWIVVESFKVTDEQDDEEVKVEIDKIVKYLYQQLQTNSDDIQRFARVSLDDMDLQLDNVDSQREGLIEGVTASAADKERVKRALAENESGQLLQKMVIILFQLLELDTKEDNFADVAEGFVQILDAMLLDGDYGGIKAISDRFAQRLQRDLRPEVHNFIEMAQQRFLQRMGESQRLAMVSQKLNSGKVQDPEGLKAYLSSLSGEAVPLICDMLENIEIANNRKIIVDVLVQIGKDHGEVFAQRLEHPSSNVVKDMLYIIDKINFDRKFHMFARVLSHPNTILRLEALHAIGRDPSEECFKIILSSFSGEDPQLRNAAARLLPNYPAERAVEVLLNSAESESFTRREKHEQKIILQSLAQINHPKAQAYFNDIFAQKAGLLGRKKVDEKKIFIIETLKTLASVPIFQLLAAQAQNLDSNSKVVAEAARIAALELRERLVGASKGKA